MVARTERVSASRWRAPVMAAVAVFFALFGLWMIVDPGNWYAEIPGVSHTGLFNSHFVRDIGIAYLTMAGALMLAVLVPAAAAPLTLVVAVFSLLHAGLHIAEHLASPLADPLHAGEAIAVCTQALVAAALAWWSRSPCAVDRSSAQTQA